MRGEGVTFSVHLLAANAVGTAGSRTMIRRRPPYKLVNTNATAQMKALLFPSGNGDM